MDDWEADDWDADNFEVPTLAGFSKANEKKFEDEDVEEEVVKPKKKVTKPKTTKKEKEKVVVDVPLDDPIAEKLRQQRLIEASDLKNAQDLFGELAEKFDDDMPKSEQLKSEQEFEAFAGLLVSKYISPHKTSSQYKSFIKAIIKSSLVDLASHQVKDIESSVVAIRNERLKSEKAAAGSKSKKANKKQQLNAGSRGGDAGEDDAQFYNKALDMDDDFDFM